MRRPLIGPMTPAAERRMRLTLLLGPLMVVMALATLTGTARAFFLICGIAHLALTCLVQAAVVWDRQRAARDADGGDR